MKIVHYCERDRCVWRAYTGGKAVCLRAKCPYGKRVSYILRSKEEKDKSTKEEKP